MKNLVFIFVLLLNLSTSAQTLDKAEAAALAEVTPEEKVFVHYNASLLFPGEYLYYKLYSLHREGGNLSGISKIGYVDLVGENNETVFRHQVPLNNGRGQGDFFIPTTLPSGKYKLLAYTQWMKNTRNYFQADLVVINPYRGDQTALTPPEDLQEHKENQWISQEQWARENRNPNQREFNLSLESHSFGKRERVSLILPTSSGALTGSFSLSVRKLDSIRNPDRPTAHDMTRTSSATRGETPMFLPEFRGKLLTGKIEPILPESERRKAGVKLAFSIPGEQLIYNVATTDEDGRFYLSFDEPRITPTLLIQILGEEKEHFQVVLDENPSLSLPDLRFPEFYITREMKSWILERSVRNQIENAYYSQKPDTLLTAEVQTPFYVKQPDLYVLDAYNRFPTIKETFIEIVQSAWISRNGKGEEMIRVREPEGASNFSLPSLLLVDGVMVQDHSEFISYPARKVESIGILRDNFYIGSHIFEGIIDVRTFDGQFWQERPTEYLQQEELQIPEAAKRYFHQSYASEANASKFLPDLRTQLFWAPELNSRSKLDFYTSDVPGTYEIVLEGFTAQGEAVSLREYFTVEE